MPIVARRSESEDACAQAGRARSARLPCPWRTGRWWSGCTAVRARARMPAIPVWVVVAHDRSYAVATASATNAAIAAVNSRLLSSQA